MLHSQMNRTCQSQFHTKKRYSVILRRPLRLLRAWSRRPSPSLIWFGRRWNQLADCRWCSSTVGTSGWRSGGCMLSSRTQNRELPSTVTLSQERVLGVLLVCCLKISSQCRGTVPHSRRTTFASSESASVRQTCRPPGGSVCQVRVSRQIHCQRSGARYGPQASPPT